jgi:hypothetical protein
MSSQVAVPDAPEPQAKTAGERLDELRRIYQKRIGRKPTSFERAALESAALMSLRYEMAARDPKASSSDVVKLHNARLRALAFLDRVVREGEDDTVPSLSSYEARA